MFDINYPFGFFIKFQATMTIHFQKQLLMQKKYMQKSHSSQRNPRVYTISFKI